MLRIRLKAHDKHKQHPPFWDLGVSCRDSVVGLKLVGLLIGLYYHASEYSESYTVSAYTSLKFRRR
jgi:hypothetical protein